MSKKKLVDNPNEWDKYLKEYEKYLKEGGKKLDSIEHPELMKSNGQLIKVFAKTINLIKRESGKKTVFLEQPELTKRNRQILKVATKTMKLMRKDLKLNKELEEYRKEEMNNVA